MIFFNAIPRRENLIIGKRYINKCLNDNLTNKFEKVDNPIISVIIPVFNCEKSIKYAISSIQNQNITNIEIILIND
jgi:cellulose synthase/poly-beta-1,6-N-acetylglucosamine synthase-like glycosyltransferase